MKIISFKTNIKNDESVKLLEPYMDKLAGVLEWNVDTNNPGNVLTVKADGIKSNDISQTIFKAGFRSEEIVPGWKRFLKVTFTRDCCSR